MMHRRRPALALVVSGFCTATATGADYAVLSRDAAAAAAARGATIVHDYGTFAWVANSGQGADAKAVYALDLGGRTFDPADDGAARASAYGSGKALRLVQFDGPIKPQWLSALSASGVTVVQYIAPFSYVVWADAASLAGAKARSGALRYAGDFLPAYKTATVHPGRARDEREWNVMLYRGAQLDAGTLRSTGAAVGRPVPMDRRFDVVRVGADAAAIDALARLPGVYAIQPVPRNGGLRAELASQITANNLGANHLPVPGYPAWLATVGANGSGVIVADVDGGVSETHPDLVNRMLPCAGDTCGGATEDPHGTHVAGIIAGDGSSGTLDAAGFQRGLGTAPGAKLVEQLYEPTMTQAGGMLKLMRQSHDNGADLSSNSWGPSATPLGYDIDTRQVDAGVRDTKPDVAGDQPMTYVLSIMNGYGGTSSQGTPDEAKNTITVGSTKGQKIGTLAADPDFNDLSANSGAGPALDGRRIPHVVAPGCQVDSTVGATGYDTMCGTSMATPQVSGAAALFVEKYRSTHAGASPSAALIKAAIVAAAQDLEGHLDADGNTLGHRPDSRQGWGRLRTDWLLGATPALWYDQNTRRFDATGQDWFANVSQADPAKPVQLVLVWTDAPGHGLGGSTPAWNNDLDLTATVGATVYKGNVFGTDGFSTAGGSAETRNNIESVVLDTAAATAAGGAITVRVAASNLVSDALPNAGDETDQDFALVCVNCVARPDYTLAVAASVQSVCTMNSATAQYDVAVGSVMGYVNPVNLALSGTPAGTTGSVTPASAPPPGTATVALSGLGAVAPATYALQLQASSASADRALPLTLTVANAPPAAPAPATPADNAINVSVTPTFHWNAPAQAGDYVFELASDAAFSTLVYTKRGKAASARPDVPLAFATQYWWRVRPSNACGAGAVSAVRTFRTQPPLDRCPEGMVASTVFRDDVEAGVGGWTTSAGIGAHNWAISTARATSGTQAWLAQDPGEESDFYLVSPAIALPADTDQVTFQFMSDQTIESKGAGGCWDGGRLEISVDGGGFDDIPPAALLTDPYDGALDDGNPAGGKQAWCGDPQAWTRSVVSLGLYAGRSVQLMFRMASDNAVGREPHGWYVDDVTVQACRAPSDAIFADGFE